MTALGTLVPASPLDASDDSRLLFTDDTDETLTRALGDTPVDFGNMDTSSWLVEYRQQGYVNDTLDLDIRIMNGATVLAAADSGGTFESVATGITSTTDVTSSATGFAYENTAASKTTWDGASVELRQTHAASKGSDGCHIEVDYVAITGTYTISSGFQAVWAKNVNTLSGAGFD